MTPCDTCNASHANTPGRIIRCMTCVVRPMQMPSKWAAAEAVDAAIAKEQT